MRPDTLPPQCWTRTPATPLHHEFGILRDAPPSQLPTVENAIKALAHPDKSTLLKRDPQVEVTTTITPTVTRQTTILASTTSAQRTNTGLSGSVSGNTGTAADPFLQSSATSSLKWWQLLAISLAGLFAILVVGWLWWRHRKRKREEAKKLKELEALEAGRRTAEADEKVHPGGGAGGKGDLEELLDALQGGRGRRKGRCRGSRRRDSESDSDPGSESESYDDISDGGTIRRSRRRRPRRRSRSRRDRRRREKDTRGRGRRGRDYYSSEWDSESSSEMSDATYYPRRLPRRHRGVQMDRIRVKDGYSSPSPPGPHVPGNRRDLPLGLGPPTATVASSSTSRAPSDRSRGNINPRPGLKRGETEKTFRDSVFSSFTSMKQAAVKLRIAEQKVKMKKALEAETQAEEARRAKVEEANRLIQEENQRIERENERLKITRAGEVTNARPASAESTYSLASIYTSPSHQSSLLQQSYNSNQNPARPEAPALRSKPLASGKSGGIDRIDRHSSELAYDIDSLLGPTGKSRSRSQRKLPHGVQVHEKQPARGARNQKGSNHSGSSTSGRSAGTSGVEGRKMPQHRQQQFRPAQPDQPVPRHESKPANPFQADWLSRPPLPHAAHSHGKPPASVPHSPTRDSVYVSMTPSDKMPTIAWGGLAHPPPGARPHRLAHTGAPLPQKPSGRTNTQQAIKDVREEDGSGEGGFGGGIAAWLGFGGKSRAEGGRDDGLEIPPVASPAQYTELEEPELAIPPVRAAGVSEHLPRWKDEATDAGRRNVPPPAGSLSGANKGASKWAARLREKKEEG